MCLSLQSNRTGYDNAAFLWISMHAAAGQASLLSGFLKSESFPNESFLIERQPEQHFERLS